MNKYLIVGIIVVVIIALLATNKKLVETLKNIYKIEELRKRILFTLGLLLIYRLGSFVVLPGVNHEALKAFTESFATGENANNLMGLLKYLLGRCVLAGFDLRAGCHALHHGLDHHTVDGNHGSLLP